MVREVVVQGLPGHLGGLSSLIDTLETPFSETSSSMALAAAIIAR